MVTQALREGARLDSDALVAASTMWSAEFLIGIAAIRGIAGRYVGVVFDSAVLLDFISLAVKPVGGWRRLRRQHLLTVAARARLVALVHNFACPSVLITVHIFRGNVCS